MIGIDSSTPINKFFRTITATSKLINEPLKYEYNNDGRYPLLFDPRVFANIEFISEEDLDFLRDKVKHNFENTSVFHLATYYANEYPSQLKILSRKNPLFRQLFEAMINLGYPKYPERVDLYKAPVSKPIKKKVEVSKKPEAIVESDVETDEDSDHEEQKLPPYDYPAPTIRVSNCNSRECTISVGPPVEITESKIEDLDLIPLISVNMTDEELNQAILTTNEAQRQFIQSVNVDSESSFLKNVYADKMTEELKLRHAKLFKSQYRNHINAFIKQSSDLLVILDSFRSNRMKYKTTKDDTKREIVLQRLSSTVKRFNTKANNLNTLMNSYYRTGELRFASRDRKAYIQRKN